MEKGVRLGKMGERERNNYATGIKSRT